MPPPAPPPPSSRLLVAGIGNIFLGDDAFGVEVARQLAGRSLSESVHVVDFGIRGLDLTFALLEDYQAVILVDATPRGEPPGTLFIIEPDVNEARGEEGLKRDADEGPTDPLEAMGMIDTHNMDPEKVLRLAWAMGGKIERVLLVGCEPAPIRSEADIRDGLSDPVRAAVDEAIPLIESLIDDLRSAKKNVPPTQP